jgi:hypothetical protein
MKWLLRQLAPDFKTIADFRKDNRLAIRQVYREFTLFCRELDLFGGELVPNRWLGKPKAFTLMHTVLSHTFFHIGQCEDGLGLLGYRTL